ncbi:MAG: L-lactate permease [Bacillota bacterium]
MDRSHRLAAVGFVLFGAALCLFLLPSNGQQFFQTNAPLGEHPFLTALLALLPPILQMALMNGCRLNGLQAALISLFLALLLAVFVWGMPAALAGHSVLYGMLTAICPVLWTLLNAMWIFRMLTRSGCFETLRQSLRRVSPDRRIQTLLVGFGLTALLESIAAFGAPIVIITSVLIGLGFPATLSAAVALISDSAPSAWGTQGMPILMLSSVTGLDAAQLGAVVGLQTPVLSALLPLGLVILVSGFKGLRGVWHIALIAGVCYGAVAMVFSRYVAVSVTGVAAGAAAIAGVLGCMRFWKPRGIWLFPGECSVDSNTPAPAPTMEVLRAWSPFLVLIATIGLVNGTGLKAMLEPYGAFSFAWPHLDRAVWAADPVTGAFRQYAAVYRQNLLTTGGTLVFLAGLLSLPLLKMKLRDAFRCYWDAFVGLLPAGGTIACILGIAYLMNYSGMAASVGLAVSFVPAQALPCVMVLLGFLGCILSGSVASGNALFGGLSLVAAGRLGADPVFIAGTLCAGGTLGKTITPQNLVMANAAIEQHTGERNARLIPRVIGMTLVYMLVLVLLAWAQSAFGAA